MAHELKTRPSYAISSVDHALHLAAVLQLEGQLTVSEAAARLGVARSTAHRLLSMLVYRDFAVQGDRRVYHPGPVLELAAHSRSEASRLRSCALPHLRRLVSLLEESANVIMRIGDSARFIASVECERALRVGDREGMVFPAHRVSAGLVLLAELSDDELVDLFAAQRYADRPDERPDLEALRRDLAHVRTQGFAVNNGLSERGVVAIGCPVRRPDGSALAGLSISVPSVRYDPRQLRSLVASVTLVAQAIETDLAAAY